VREWASSNDDRSASERFLADARAIVTWHAIDVVGLRPIV